MKLHEALNIDLNEINREIKNLVTHDKDVPKSRSWRRAFSN